MWCSTLGGLAGLAVATGTGGSRNQQLAGAAVITDHHNITVGACVAVEQGRHANIRRVSPVMCNDLAATSRPAYSPVHQAKREVLDAQTEEAIRLAHMRMRALCEN